jgi:hypothetical protein
MEEKNRDALEKMENRNNDSMRMIEGLRKSFKKSEEKVKDL